MKTSDTIKYKKLGFDGDKYIERQRDAILERIGKFDGRLYLEIGGKFLYDPHAARVLPGFLVDSKKIIFSELKDNADIIFCINAKDLETNRQLSSEKISYSESCIEMMQNIRMEMGIIPYISINRVTEENLEIASKFKNFLSTLGYKISLRYEIKGYPKKTKNVLSENGYGKDEYIDIKNNLVLVTGAASSSGKMSTCLGQIYSENIKGIDSGYAKYETFPIWNLELSHPVNLAYEAATADVGDFNKMDKYHIDAYAMNAVNYNRDVEAFEIVRDLAKAFLPKSNFTRKYKSPTDMGISRAGFCITDNDIVSKAAIEEIDRRIEWYKKIIDRGEGDKIWITRCLDIKNRL